MGTQTSFVFQMFSQTGIGNFLFGALFYFSNFVFSDLSTSILAIRYYLGKEKQAGNKGRAGEKKKEMTKTMKTFQRKGQDKVDNWFKIGESNDIDNNNNNLIKKSLLLITYVVRLQR